MPPVRITAGSVPRGRNWLARISIQPTGHPIGVHLLAPNQAAASLPQNAHLLFADIIGRDGGIKVVSVMLPAGHDLVEVLIGPGAGLGAHDLIGPV